MFVLRGADQSNLHIKKKKERKKQRGKKWKHARSCFVPLTGGVEGGDRSEKIWGGPPLQKVTQREVSERVGCVVGVGWSYMGPRGSVSAPQAHPVWDGIGHRGVSFPGRGGGGKGMDQRGKWHPYSSSSSKDEGTEVAWRSTSQSVCLLPYVFSFHP